jgi:hypothetical protein
MELHESIFAPTLAHKLGETLHISPLLRKIVARCGSVELAGDWLLNAAITRGASHYRPNFRAGLPPDDPNFTGEEIGVALCLGHLRDDPMYVRAAAQLLSSPGTDAKVVARLAEMERCDAVLFHVAKAAERVDPALEPWASLRTLLHPRKLAREDVLPHWTRFVSMTGVTREGGSRTDWLTRHE